MTIIFHTPRLYLRRFTLADAPLVQQLNSDPAVLRYLHEPPLETVEHAEEILRTIILPQYENKLGRWAIHISNTHEFIGWCGLKYRPELDEIDLGYRLKPSAWGNGYAFEAAQHTIQYGLKELQLTCITGRAHVENTASLNILEKLGMQFIKEEIVDNCPVKTYIIRNK
ncbi:MAG: GNAT family N-acetyltransferase [Bacteroidetes bacterium]|nr:GNAT family N-acetyltransferase [Bacteroidota bacterium]